MSTEPDYNYTILATVERWWIEALEHAEETDLEEDWDAAEAIGQICDQMEGLV